MIVWIRKEPMSTAQIKTLEDFIQLQNRNALAHAIRAAVQLGIFEALLPGQKTIKQLATELKLETQPLERLMKVLLQTELLENYGDDFALSTIARLIPGAAMDFGDDHWQYLVAHVRSGKSLASDESLPYTDKDYQLNKASEEWTLTPVALDAAQVLDVGKSRRGLRILELGCGSAVFGVTLAHRDPESVLHLLDRSIELKRAQKTVDSVELQSRTQFFEASDWTQLTDNEDIGDQQFDLILLAGLIHRLSKEQLVTVLGQLRNIAQPGCELAIIDVFPGQENGDIQRAVFELELGLRTSCGQLHDPKELEAALKDAGFVSVQYAHLPSLPCFWGLLLAEV